MAPRSEWAALPALVLPSACAALAHQVSARRAPRPGRAHLEGAGEPQHADLRRLSASAQGRRTRASLSPDRSALRLSKQRRPRARPVRHRPEARHGAARRHPQCRRDPAARAVARADLLRRALHQRSRPLQESLRAGAGSRGEFRAPGRHDPARRGAGIRDGSPGTERGPDAERPARARFRPSSRPASGRTR